MESAQQVRDLQGRYPYLFQRTDRQGRITHVGLDTIERAVQWCEEATASGDTIFEYIHGPQKIRFDIDDKRPRPYEAKQKNARGVITHIRWKLWELYRTTAHVLFDMSQRSQMIVSYHLIFSTLCVPDASHAKAIMHLCTCDLTEEQRCIVDASVYNKASFLRIENSDKYAAGRPKRRVDGSVDGAYPDGLITYTEGCTMVYATVADPAEPSHPVDPMGQSTFMCAGETYTLGVDLAVRLRQGNLICLQRLRPTWCGTCRRVHDHENPYIVKKEEGWYFCCRRSPVLSRIHAKDTGDAQGR